MMAATAPDDLITLAELRRRLAELGVELSGRQLKRLRAEGLLPCAGQRHPPGLRGSTSDYPRWAVEQLELVTRLARRERRYLQLRLLVRWHGGWVEPSRLREALITLLDRVSAHARELAAGPGNDGDRADRLARAMRAAPGRGAAARLMRRRLGRAAFDRERVEFVLSALAVGAEIEWDTHDPDDPMESLTAVLERASGLDRARRDTFIGVGPLFADAEPTPAILERLGAAGCFDLLDLGRPFREADDRAIQQAFTDARQLAGLAPFFRALQALAGEDVAGSASFTELTDEELSAWDVAALVRNCLLFRPVVPDAAFETVARAATRALSELEAELERRNATP